MYMSVVSYSVFQQNRGRLFRPAFLQDAIKLQHEAAGGDEGGDEITHRFREEDGEDMIRQELWQDQDERD